MQRRILNVGCGRETYGTDFVDKYPQRKEVIKCDIERQKLPFKSSTFDEVYSANVFEHLKNPNFALKEMIRVLKRGGRLVIKTDNAGFWLFHNVKSKQKTHYGGYETHGAYGKEDRHYALFTPHHVKNHLEALGVKIIETKYYSDFDSLSIPIRIINTLLSKTRFRWMTYPKFLVVGIKNNKK